jgi:hypothetical protein
VIVAPKCARCGADMIEGFMVETGLLSNPRPTWAEGRPTVHVFTGTLQTSERDLRGVQTFRCIRCGYLESYATEPAS